ncbi:Rna/Rnp Complex-1-Interacting Phosphatase [Manis pentadactyla]|nr:Rna/Rnp Complex-1-Interacting Phosphatase [Manis pentadactyla]
MASPPVAGVDAWSQSEEDLEQSCCWQCEQEVKTSFEENLAPEECFSPLDLFNKVQEQNEELGLIVDLTYTHRYYKPETNLLASTVPMV